CQVPRMLQHNNRLQPLPNCCCVWQLPDCLVPTNRRPCKAHRRMLLQEEGRLSEFTKFSLGLIKLLLRQMQGSEQLLCLQAGCHALNPVVIAQWDREEEADALKRVRHWMTDKIINVKSHPSLNSNAVSKPGFDLMIAKTLHGPVVMFKESRISSLILLELSITRF
ncbi:hypothetical protein Droror1_Dr00021710, partial [Drosera rotundifolia]